MVPGPFAPMTSQISLILVLRGADGERVVLVEFAPLEPAGAGDQVDGLRAGTGDVVAHVGGDTDPPHTAWSRDRLHQLPSWWVLGS
jgi:hypothetical protein